MNMRAPGFNESHASQGNLHDNEMSLGGADPHMSSALNIPSYANHDEDEDKIEYVKVVKDTEFINEFKRRANDSEWLTFNCI